eukprot:16441897-Heterocapsa_arctica.AAC.1
MKLTEEFPPRPSSTATTKIKYHIDYMRYTDDISKYSQGAYKGETRTRALYTLPPLPSFQTVWHEGVSERASER